MVKNILTLTSFDGPLPVQMDGEPFQAQEYDIACVPHALNVLVP